MTIQTVTRFIPEGGKPFDTKGTDLAIYVYTGKDGKPCAIGYRGRKVKPTFRWAFKTENTRDLYLSNEITRRSAELAEKAAADAKRKAPHSLEVGNILHTCWGHEQTNVEFFEVVEVLSPHYVMLRELEQDRSYTNEMCGTCTPRPGVYKRDAFRVKVDGFNSVKLSSYRFAFPGGGMKHWSSYA